MDKSRIESHFREWLKVPPGALDCGQARLVGSTRWSWSALRIDPVMDAVCTVQTRNFGRQDDR